MILLMLGGIGLEKCILTPFDGKAFLKHIEPTSTDLSAEIAYEKQTLARRKEEKKDEGDIELF